MRKSDFSTIRAVRNAIRMVLEANVLDRNPVPYFEPTDFGSLEPQAQNKVLQAKKANEHANRARSASYLCMSAAHDVLASSMALSTMPFDITVRERESQMASIAAATRNAADLVERAAEILMGKADPPADGALVVSLLDAPQ